MKRMKKPKEVNLKTAPMSRHGGAIRIFDLTLDSFMSLARHNFRLTAHSNSFSCASSLVHVFVMVQKWELALVSISFSLFFISYISPFFFHLLFNLKVFLPAVIKRNELAFKREYTAAAISILCATSLSAGIGIHIILEFLHLISWQFFVS